MIVLELMSDGKIAKLPDVLGKTGLPSHLSVKVALLLPFNRVLVGSSIQGIDYWVWGKLGNDEWNEVSLYDDVSLVLRDGSIPDITLNADVINKLRKTLFEQIPPPGNHLSTVLVLRGISLGPGIPGDNHEWNNERWFISQISENDILLKAYWGIRRALFEKNPEMLERIKAWYVYASDVFNEEYNYPRMWFSIIDLPGESDLEDIESFGFTRDNLKTMNAKFSNPIVLSNILGYLILLTDYAGENRNEVKIWMYINVSLWDELREKRKLSIREIVSTGWGFLDALDAESMMTRYGNQQGNREEIRT